MTEQVNNKGRNKLFILLVIGHTGIHWFKQIYPILLPTIKSELELTDVQIGTIVTANEAASGTLTMPSGIIADTYYKHRGLILGGALVLCGLAYFLVGFYANYLFVILGFMVLGLASAAWHPAAQSSLSTFFPDKRGFALAGHGMGASIGDTIAPVAIGFLLLYFSWSNLAQWQFIPAVILGLIIFSLTRKSFHTNVSPPSLSNYVSGIKELLMNPFVLAVMFASSFVGMARLAIIGFLTIYLTEYLGYPPYWVGINWALLYVMGIVSQPIMGYVSDKFSRKTVVLPAFLTLSVCYFLIPFATNPIVLGIIIGAMGMFFYGTSNITTAAVLDVAQSQLHGTSTSIMSVFRQVFTLPSPIIAAYIITIYGMSALFYYAAILLLVASVFWAFIKIPKA
jgi:sugar phosphate permease